MSYALLTGASSGLGIEFAKLLGENKIPMVISSSERSEKKLLEFAKELSDKYDVDVKTFSANLDEADSVPKLVRWIDAQNIEIDFLINNAGFGISGHKVQDYDPKKFKDMLQVNIMALSELMSVYTPRMVAKGKGKILNISSIAGYVVPHALEAAYAASKAYVVSLSEGAAEDLRGTGVTCTHLAPGATRTEFFNTAGLADDSKVGRFYMEAPEVTKAGFDAMMKGKVTVLPGIANKIMKYASLLSPSRRLVGHISGSMLS